MANRKRIRKVRKPPADGLTLAERIDKQRKERELQQNGGAPQQTEQPQPNGSVPQQNEQTREKETPVSEKEQPKEHRRKQSKQHGASQSRSSSIGSLARSVSLNLDLNHQNDDVSYTSAPTTPLRPRTDSAKNERGSEILPLIAVSKGNESKQSSSTTPDEVKRHLSLPALDNGDTSPSRGASSSHSEPSKGKKAKKKKKPKPFLPNIDNKEPADDDGGFEELMAKDLVQEITAPFSKWRITNHFNGLIHSGMFWSLNCVIIGRVMVCRLISVKPLLELMPTYCQLNPYEQTQNKFESTWKSISKR